MGLHGSTWQPHEEDIPGSTLSLKYRRRVFTTHSLYPMKHLLRCGAWQMETMISCDINCVIRHQSTCTDFLWRHHNVDARWTSGSGMYRLFVQPCSPSKMLLGVQQ